jgi:hypothetical protein
MERMEVSFGILIHHQRKLYSSRLEREREREMLERERQNDAGASVCLSGCSLQRWIDGCIDRCLANSLLLVVEREGERGFLVVNYLVALLLEREREQG